ncbi:MAG: phosphate signaling complex protein PhoU [Burkholderiales bacterium]|nr:phosphate signaling complex protein PhoU [Burkholderiales bacterium]
MQHKHTSSQFDAQLEQIRSKVLHMGGAVEDQLSLAVRSLQAGEMYLIEQVLDVELQVNALEMEIDELCTNIIARRTPTAIDLRMVTMVVKTITDLERVGDEAKKIVLMAREFFRSGRGHMPRYSEIQRMSGIVIDMLRDALDGFARLDAETAPSIARRDLEVDDSFRAILRELLTYMIEDPRTISATLDTVFIAKALERVGDHAKNISEYVVYMIMGKDVRHLSADEIELAVKS